jgi:hypothetical protein
MVELKASLGSYELKDTLAHDNAVANGCFILDVGSNERGSPVPSLARVAEIVDDYIINCHDRLEPVRKLYVIGDWKLASQAKVDEDDEERPEERKRYSKEVG